MFPKDAEGFTLLELLFSLLIIGIALAIGAVFYHPRTSELEKNVNILTGALSRARVEAMLSRERTALEFSGSKIRLLTGNGEKQELLTLAPNVGVRINGKNLMMNKRVQISFSPLGYAQENMIYLYTPEESWTIYTPALSAPFFQRGHFNPKEIRKEAP